MSVIKEIYDVANDAAALKQKRSAIKRALRTELKLNHKFLQDVKAKDVDDKRRIEMLKMLEIEELASAVKLEIPYTLLSRKEVDEEIATRYRAKPIQGFSIGDLIENLYLMISYLKKDYKNPRIHLNLRLINIYKYNRVLIELLK
ncbi:hypothetical protein [Ekhidna sp.]|uniref:hypothetical protein n=1 Tax=Ekhidna sp. TaxID=2608089 RepID=UPI003513C58A